MVSARHGREIQTRRRSSHHRPEPRRRDVRRQDAQRLTIGGQDGVFTRDDAADPQATQADHQRLLGGHASAHLDRHRHRQSTSPRSRAASRKSNASADGNCWPADSTPKRRTNGRTRSRCSAQTVARQALPNTPPIRSCTAPSAPATTASRSSASRRRKGTNLVGADQDDIDPRSHVDAARGKSTGQDEVR